MKTENAQPGRNRAFSPVLPRLTSRGRRAFPAEVATQDYVLRYLHWGEMGRRHPKPNVVVEVVWVVPVAARTAGIPTIVVERPATQDAALYRLALPPNVQRQAYCTPQFALGNGLCPFPRPHPHRNQRFTCACGTVQAENRNSRTFRRESPLRGCYAPCGRSARDAATRNPMP